jgi:hypothetical protein
MVPCTVIPRATWRSRSGPVRDAAVRERTEDEELGRWGGVDGRTLPPHPPVPLQGWEAGVMGLREQFESVLRKHGINVNECGWIELDVDHGKNHSGLINDLLTCLPQPSRKELEEILDNTTCTIVDEKMIVIAREGRLGEIFMKKLLAWASGQREQTWCEHIQPDPSDRNFWILTAEGSVYHQKTLRVWNWKFCPLCATPRPPDA